LINLLTLEVDFFKCLSFILSKLSKQYIQVEYYKYNTVGIRKPEKSGIQIQKGIQKLDKFGFQMVHFRKGHDLNSRPFENQINLSGFLIVG
jgi:hypothetical protein